MKLRPDPDEREHHSGHAVVQHAGGGSFKSQMKKADGSGAWLALIVGEDELGKGEVAVKPLRRNEPQARIPRGQLVQGFAGLLEKAKN